MTEWSCFIWRCQRMFSLLYNCAHFTYFQVYDQISFKLGFSNMWTENFQMYKLGFKEAEEPEIKLPAFVGSWRKQRSSRKTSTSASLTMLKSLTMWMTTNCRKFLDANTRPPCLSLRRGQEATIRIGHRTTNWFKSFEKSITRLNTVTLLI